ncbi:type II toxin-antitoxin system RelE/ParE family toxin [Thiocapsa marina]|uniref:Plasmid stabilization system n=1 Tax=Thiocapsa marina 5811 TaxID=768671 RepID=F9UH93_9GAMM|nr:type II toxin-antitoxin system YafQ family toxin [Thiocapsa marina]EGV16351.1 plasmid stabilization system [Thiocapsa marina 5811]
MRPLVVTPKFRRAYRKLIKRDRTLQGDIDGVLRNLQADVFSAALGTHKLSGSLLGLWACSCGYDCRVVFALQADAESGEEVILLLDIGTHDEVY